MLLRIKKLNFLVLLASLAATARPLPLRTAVFKKSQRQTQAAVMIDQDRILNAETPEQKERPIWVHGGDSLSMAWASSSSLRTRLSGADNDPVMDEFLDKKVYRDYLQNGPDPKLTWYAGLNIEGGVLGRLERESSKQWVILSAALGGALLSIQFDEDNLKSLIAVKEPERVEVVTFSLGGNDLCWGYNPAEDMDLLKQRLREVKNRFGSKTVFGVWAVPNVKEFRKRLMDRLHQLPASSARDKTIRYCTKMWDEVNCPEGSDVMSNTNRLKINAALSEVFGTLYDSMSATQDKDLLDVFGADCFHPGIEMQKSIAESFYRFISERRSSQAR